MASRREGLFACPPGRKPASRRPDGTVLYAPWCADSGTPPGVECEDRERLGACAQSTVLPRDRMRRVDDDAGMRSAFSSLANVGGSEQCRCTTEGPPVDIPNDESAPCEKLVAGRPL
ncbi:hypothetical protein HPB50_020440 [Hyalomma asiaticum]|uniref:Uncharacterized protein n=1 Tax=Hyalomma asiaticum TaxID=266040 RepID=A0ACB7S4H8_HYAAI|nr:hypothetical protein HPB50_020440 [Hyalomma asiaticum]